ncbi:uncharacterized protein LY79DRAFT_327351 [Colletotrichum navitas]|uniref:Uncharacterized protein n=1 Tax=Colletotrichum navitas TaxID=681940 RepID=A0AAD8QAK1_9PEZI|nr:uncharacterized protein LY79DRAFT_327351 [Colletotrichum navitas]KAK1598062.1 hypothetical protein LY79DRAFT_327351 [Colletotrichum navitas]
MQTQTDNTKTVPGTSPYSFLLRIWQAWFSLVVPFGSGPVLPPLSITDCAFFLPTSLLSTCRPSFPSLGYYRLHSSGEVENPISWYPSWSSRWWNIYYLCEFETQELKLRPGAHRMRTAGLRPLLCIFATSTWQPNIGARRHIDTSTATPSVYATRMVVHEPWNSPLAPRFQGRPQRFPAFRET